MTDLWTLPIGCGATEITVGRTSYRQGRGRPTSLSVGKMIDPVTAVGALAAHLGLQLTAHSG